MRRSRPPFVLGLSVAHKRSKALRSVALIVCTSAAILGTVGFVSARVDLSRSTVPQQPATMNTTSAGTAASGPNLLTAPVDGRTPEGQLILSYQLLARGEESQALATLEQLVTEWPEFALAQLVYGDMLLARSGRESPLSVGSKAALGAKTERIANLRQESVLRLSALMERPPRDAIPKDLLYLSAAVRHAIVVDASRARLYLFENSPQGLQLVRDSYVSLGKLGIGKLVEGDQRTPLGSYHVGLRRDEAAERYGAAALPLNYPNEYDRAVGRGGSSIWLHGERIGSYARGPQSTDGCIVLSNDEMAFLADTVAPFETPVVVVEKVEWVQRDSAPSPLRPAFKQAYQQWQEARLQQNPLALRALYEPGLQRGTDSQAEILERNLARMAKKEMPLNSIEQVSVLPWKDEQEVVIVNYREIGPSGSKPRLKRQYWRAHEGQWRIFFDGVVG